MLPMGGPPCLQPLYTCSVSAALTPAPCATPNRSLPHPHCSGWPLLQLSHTEAGGLDTKPPGPRTASILRQVLKEHLELNSGIMRTIQPPLLFFCQYLGLQIPTSSQNHRLCDLEVSEESEMGSSLQ